MAQGIFGGATSYEKQSLKDILEDIQKWITYTKSVKQSLSEKADLLRQNNYWNKVRFDFQMTILSTLSFLDTISFDLVIIENAILADCITEKEVMLLRKIGVQSVQSNEEYGHTYSENTQYWHDYDNPDFMVVEKVYIEGRDYFVTMQDAGNAAARLEDYMEKGQVVNHTLNVGGSITGSQIQQGVTSSSQSMSVENAFDYQEVLSTLTKIEKYLGNAEFNEDFGDKAETVKKVVADTIVMANMQEEPSKIKKALTTLKDLAIGVSGSLIASGICGMLAQLPH